MQVVVSEKPSVARDIARVLGARGRGQGVIRGEGVAITWCHGHMAELQEPVHYNPDWRGWSLSSLPMLPEAFELKLRADAADQFAVLKELLCDPKTEEVVNACDAGREGELIFRYVYELAGCTAPVKRLWISSLTDEAIREGWAALRPGADFDRLADAARCRSQADWLVGLNSTRALTCRAREAGGSGLLSVGRVQTPTLAMIVERDHEIEHFVPEDFWQVKARFREANAESPASADTPAGPGESPGGAPTGEAGAEQARPIEWESIFFRPKVREPRQEGKGKGKGEGQPKEVPQAERLSTEAAATLVRAATEGGVGRVEKAERRRTRERPPLLYDLTSLQRRANQRYGLSAQDTLDLAQALYEQHKLLTYPRTDAKHLTPDQESTLPDILKGLAPIGVYAPFVQDLLSRQPIKPGSRVINAAEVGDHHAIIPTGKTPGSGLSTDEKRIFDLVVRRFLAALSADALFDVTRLVVAVDPGDAELPDGVEAPLRYRARGRVCRQEGWRAVDPPKKSKEVELPGVEVDDVVAPIRTRVAKGQTRPPRPHNDATLLRAMETAGKVLDDNLLARALRGKGLGTPATRAGILQVLLHRSYIERNGRDLRATDKGQALINAVPVDALKSAELTGEWEGKLSDLAEGGGPGTDAFMKEVEAYVIEVVEAIRAADPPEVDPEDIEPELGKCPACGKPVRQRGRIWTCDTGRDCSFVVFAEMSKRTISGRMVKQLLTEGRSQAVKGFRSKAGKDFTAGLVWDEAKQRVGFWFPDRARDEDPGPPPGPPGPPQGAQAPPPSSSGSLDALPPVAEGDPCPSCGQGRVIRGRHALGCSRWREGCTFRTG